MVEKIGDMVLLFPKKYSANRLKALLASFDKDFTIKREQPRAADQRDVG